MHNKTGDILHTKHKNPDSNAKRKSLRGGTKVFDLTIPKPQLISEVF
jgi:hypothetical protein